MVLAEVLSDDYALGCIRACYRTRNSSTSVTTLGYVAAAALWHWLGPREIARFQLEKISDSSAQDLCGNAFSAPIIFALLVAVLLQYDE